MYVLGHIGWPPGFYFQATICMTEKLHGAICKTQHEGGPLLLSPLFSLNFLSASVPWVVILLCVEGAEVEKDSREFV